MKARMLGALVMSLLAMVSLGCHKKPVVIDPGITGTTPTATTPDNGTGLPGIDTAGTQWEPATDMQKIFFDYDSFTLRPDAIKTLNENAEKMKTRDAKILFQIEGHCDERGTQEYNLALGEKRALAVRDYLMKVGIEGNRVVTVSYGEEKPAVEGTGESVWQQNRRAEFNQSK